jgi:hypothetical protein
MKGVRETQIANDTHIQIFHCYDSPRHLQLSPHPSALSLSAAQYLLSKDEDFDLSALTPH